MTSASLIQVPKRRDNGLVATPRPPSSQTSLLASAGDVKRVAGTCSPAEAARRLVEQGCAALPLPGQGQTLERWRALAAVGATDLALTKLFEAHTDAVAILAELAPREAHASDGLWSVWAAEGAGTVLRVCEDAPARALRSGEQVQLKGTKPWCSGAFDVDHALVTAFTADGQRQLFAIDMDSPGLSVDGHRWCAVGMAASQSADVHFDQVLATAVGTSDAYFDRPGFWHGGAGIAACWFGAAQALAQVVSQAAESAHAKARALRSVALGRISLALAESAALLVHTASLIDDDPSSDWQSAVRRLRLSVDKTARTVLDESLRALGPTPFCRDAALGQLAADLPIFLRQCHGDMDLMTLGEDFRKASSTAAWPL